MQDQLQQLIELYQSAAKLAGKEPLVNLLDEQGKLRKLFLPCPMCYCEEDATQRLSFSEETMQFNFNQHTLFCENCGEEFYLPQILKELKTKADILSEQLEGFALLLPKIQNFVTDTEKA